MTNRAAEFALTYQNPFHKDKVWLHQAAVEKLAQDELVAPATVEIDLTDGACNQSCLHCCFHSGEGQKLVQIDPNRILQILTELKTMGTRGIEFVGGGEPTAHKHVHYIIEETLKLGFDVGLITNGLLAHRVADLAKELAFIRISLDSANQHTYDTMHGVTAGKQDFDKVLNNIRLLRKQIPLNNRGQMQLGIGYLVVPPFNHTQAEVLAAAQLANDLQVDYLVYRPAQLGQDADYSQWQSAQEAIGEARILLSNSHTQILGSAQTRWESLLPENHPKGRCDGRPLVGIIRANGEIAFCNLRRNQSNLRIGNIHEGSFSDQWFSQKNQDAFNNFNINDCPVPCKINAYTAVVRSRRQGTQIFPNEAEIGHPNHI